MPTKYPALVGLVFAATLGACSSPSETPAPAAGQPSPRGAPVSPSGATARAALEKARQPARAWRPDARLQKVMTVYANKQGKVSTEMPAGIMFPWQFIYMSAEAGKAIIVDSNGKEVRSSGLESWGLFQPISEEFVDSDQALAEAVRNGYAPDESLAMELSLQWGPKRFSEPTWVIGSPGDTQYLVSGTTAKFVGREAP